MSYQKPYRHIRRAAVLGSGVMGSQIALHLANIGVEVLLLDRTPDTLTPDETWAGKSLTDRTVKNRIVQQSFQAAVKLSPEPLYHAAFANRVSLGNLEDDLARIAEVDWIIEVVVERLDIKQKVFSAVEQFRKPGTLISSNTSGIPIEDLIQGRSEDFTAHFLGTHFFNPPRYLKLLEVIPSTKTKPEVVDFFLHYGEKFLGKTTVLCKDTPAFIANRIGVFSIMSLFHMMENSNLSIPDIDRLTGPVLGRPKSATFRTADVVGLDTLVNVAKGLQANLTADEAADKFMLPGFLQTMVEKGWLGQKSGQGFYKKVSLPSGGSDILALNLKTMDYEPQVKRKFATLEAAKPIDNIVQRFKMLVAGKDEAADFYRSSFYALFQYAAFRVPEIADNLSRIDEALKAGFGWALGPFESWDALGWGDTLSAMTKAGYDLPDWVHDMEKNGYRSFYRIKNGLKEVYHPQSGKYHALEGRNGFIILSDLTERKVWGNAGTTLTDIGDGVLNLAFHTKMNSIGSEVLSGIQKSIQVAEDEGWRGLVIANEGEHFSAGANLALILMLAIEQEWDELNFAVRAFQQTTMRIRYSDIPVVVAPHGLTLGGGCEICLHADAVVAHAETYIGLVEVGVGVIPGGGGTKEFALRTSDDIKDGDVRINTLRNRFLTIGMAKVATSAHQAFDLGICRKGIDKVVPSRMRQLAEAKAEVIRLFDSGYTRPIQRQDIQVLGNEGMGIVYAGANTMHAGHYISDHDKLISEKLGYVLCGGNLSEKSMVSEQYLLDLEREAFLSLLGTKPTLERIQHMLKTGKPLRN
jgi:3-hydroxyacyl-CoA dehydrogenase